MLLPALIILIVGFAFSGPRVWHGYHHRHYQYHHHKNHYGRFISKNE